VVGWADGDANPAAIGQQADERLALVGGGDGIAQCGRGAVYLSGALLRDLELGFGDRLPRRNPVARHVLFAGRVADGNGAVTAEATLPGRRGHDEHENAATLDLIVAEQLSDLLPFLLIR
jgi:hypothetical protein